MPVENISKKPTFLLNKRVNLKEKIHSAFKAPSVVCVDKQNVLPYLLDPKNLNEDESKHWMSQHFQSTCTHSIVVS